MAPIQLDPTTADSGPIQAPQIQRPGESKTQTITRLAAELKVAKMAKTHAERKLIELQDQTSQREKLYDIATQQCETAWETMAELKKQLAAQDVVIKKLREDAKEYPDSSSSLKKSYDQLNSIIETLRECLSCPLCYDALTKGVAVSLRCGHTFCQRCIDAWATTSNTNPSTTTYESRSAGVGGGGGGEEEGKRVQCPECRTEGKARIRIYMLEEAVRLVDRAQRQRHSILNDELNRRLKLESLDFNDNDAPIFPTDYLQD